MVVPCIRSAPQDAAIYIKRRAGDVPGFFRCKEPDRAGDILGSSELAQRNAARNRMSLISSQTLAHVGLDLAWRDRVYGDAIWTEVARKRLGESKKTTLGARVRDRAAHSTCLRRNRSDVDYSTPSTLAHSVGDRLNVVEGSGQIYAEH